MLGGVDVSNGIMGNKVTRNFANGPEIHPESPMVPDYFYA